MKGRDHAPWNAINSLTGIRAMKREIWRSGFHSWRVVASVAILAVIAPLIGCGQGVGENTGSILLINVKSIDRNVDTFPDDTSDPPDGTIDHYLTDRTITMTFTNRSAVPDIERPGTDTTATSDTDTILTVESYRIDYTTDDPTAPALESREYSTEFWNGLVTAEELVERSDIMLASLATVGEYNDKVVGGAIPTDVVPEYVAHYTFRYKNARFEEWDTEELDVSFSIGDFIPATN